MSGYRWVPWLLFLILLIHGGSIELTDDEAYYWVLGQTPAWGYGYHPPMVAWMTGISDALLNWTAADNPLRVRLASAAITSGILWVLLRALIEQGVTSKNSTRSALVLLGLAGMFGASWMMVPDLPLFFGWAILWRYTWQVIALEVGRPTWRSLIGLLIGSVIVLTSKYSGVLAIGSSGLAILIWGKRVRLSACSALAIGAVLGVVPILLAAHQNGWGSLLYQIHDRHSDSELSWTRYLRFWVIQLFAVGPMAFAWVATLSKRLRARGIERRVILYSLTWWVPAALIFWIQPLFSDFKPHWAIAVWLPIALEMAYWVGVQGWTRIARWHCVYGGLLILLVAAAFHTTWIPQIAQLLSGHPIEPKWDVSNDVFGWRLLRSRMQADPDLRGMRVVGLRYQTASQAAFVLNGVSSVALVPRDQKQLYEWPQAAEFDSQGPDWPTLLAPVLVVSDNRYDAASEFRMAHCETVDRLTDYRGPFVAKWIQIDRCVPFRP